MSSSPLSAQPSPVSNSKSQSQMLPWKGPTSNPAMAALAILGLIGLLLSPVNVIYTASATMKISSKTDAKKFAKAFHTNSIFEYANQSVNAELESGKVVTFAYDVTNPSTCDIMAESSSRSGAVSMADHAAAALIALFHSASPGPPGRIETAHITSLATRTGARVSGDSPISPAVYAAEVTAFSIALVAGTIGFVGKGGLHALLIRGKADKEPKAMSPASSNPARRQNSRVKATDDEIQLLAAAIADRAPRPALPVHTLITVHQVTASFDGLSDPAGAVPTYERTEPASKIPVPAQKHFPIGKIEQLTFTTDIEPIFLQRLDEYKAAKPHEGCVLIITETMPGDSMARVTSSKLNGATASIALARKLSEVRGSPTLLIDSGSAAWSKDKTGYQAADIIPYAAESGIFDIIARGLPTQDWALIPDENHHGLTVLGAGAIPSTWANDLRSEGFHDLIKNARSLADLVLIYGPRCIECPEIIRSVDSWANGVMVVSGNNQLSRAAEVHALAVLRSAGATLFGRIELDIDLAPG